MMVTTELLRLNGLERGHYAEPYAGGCGLALSLLYGGFVADIHINDIDPAIWSFWHSVLYNSKAFLKKVEQTPVTVDEWARQRDIFRSKSNRSTLALGFSAFFLNRTNRSGIIKDAGVIGGLDQLGPYKIDCRFNVEDLSRRIARISKYEERICLTSLDALDFMEEIDRTVPKESLLFIDPPYFKKGAELYTNFYRREDHVEVADLVTSLKRPWLVTYDNTPEINSLYKGNRQYTFDLTYSVQKKRVGTELLIASKGMKVPNSLRERQVNRPQYRAA